MSRSFSHFTQDERVRLEYLYLKEGLPVSTIAKLLNKHRATIYRELERGKCFVRDYSYKLVSSYSAQNAIIKYKENMRKHGRKNKLSNDLFLKSLIIYYIKEKRYSVKATLAEIKVKYKKFKFKISFMCIYRYMYSDKYDDLTEKDLIYKRFIKRDKTKIIYIRSRLYGKSIEERPKYVLKRKELGHWEMDTVIGAIGKSKRSFLVLTERKTRFELIFLLAAHTVNAVCDKLNVLENYLENRFRKVFKTITVDNGTEFSDAKLLETSIYGGKRFDMYFCHPHCSSERGSNENQNRFIRRFYKKGVNFDNINNKDIIDMENFINNYPRKIFNFKNSNYYFMKYTNSLKINFENLIRT